MSPRARRARLRLLASGGFLLAVVLGCTAAVATGDVTGALAHLEIPSAISVLLMALAPGGALFTLAKGIAAMKEARSSVTVTTGAGASDVLGYLQGEQAQKVSGLLDALTRLIADSNLQQKEILQQLQALNAWTLEHGKEDNVMFDRLFKAVARVEDHVIKGRP